MNSSSNGLKRYNLVLPQDLFDEVQTVAERRHTTVVDMIRRFIKLGLIAVQVEETPDAVLLIRKDDIEQQIILI